MIKRLIILSAVLTVYFQTIPLTAAQKEPLFEITVMDQETKQPVIDHDINILKTSSDEKKTGFFTYTISVTAPDYKPYEHTLEIPYAERKKTFILTNYLIALPPPVIEKKAEKEEILKPEFVTISGYILNEDKEPVPNTLVQCYNEYGDLLAELTTSENGKYIFTNLLPRQYMIHALNSRELTARQIVFSGKDFQTTEKYAPVMDPAAEGLSTPGTIEPGHQQESRLVIQDRITILESRNQTLRLEVDLPESIIAYVLGIKIDGRIWYIDPHGNRLVTEKREVFLTNAVISLDGSRIKKDGIPIFKDNTSFDLYVYEVMESYVVPPTPLILKKLMTTDTVPPSLPVLRHVAFSNEQIHLFWDRPYTPEAESLYYNIYIGDQDLFRFLTTVKNKETARSIHYVIDPESWILDVSKESIFTVTALDQAGNESEFRDQKIDIEAKMDINRNIILVKTNIPSEAVKRRPKKVLTPLQNLARGNYLVPRGGTVLIEKETIRMAPDHAITVSAGSTLILRNVLLRARSSQKWSGIIVYPGGKLVLENTDLSGAKTGITLKKSASCRIQNSRISYCFTGINAVSGISKILDSHILQTTRPLSISSGSLSMYRTGIYDNQTAPRMTGGNIKIENCRFSRNASGLVLSGVQGYIRFSRFMNNPENGLFLEASPVSISDCDLSENGQNGILCSFSNPEIRKCNIFKNGYYAVSGGGMIDNCFISENNGSEKTDTTPDTGQNDEKFNSASNMRIIQVYQADSLSGMRLAPVTR